MPAKDPTVGEIDELDRIYRQGGIRQMALPHIHYHDPFCPHAGCGHKMEWIDYQLKLLGDRDGIYGPLVRSWWEGQGRWPMSQLPPVDSIYYAGYGIPTADQVDQLPHLPENWHTVAQFG